MLIERPEYLDKLIKYKDKDLIKVVTGVQRCGKSVLLLTLFSDYLLNNGIASEHIIKVNLENKNNISLRDSDRLYTFVRSRMVSPGKCYVMIDEIQYVNGTDGVKKRSTGRY